MKKFISTVLLSMICVGLHAQIAVPPSEFAVSELMFDAEGTWTMELGNIINLEYPSLREVDSIYLTSSMGSAKVKSLNYGDEFISEIILLNKEDLASGLPINPAGDYVRVTTYYNQYHGETGKFVNHTLIFGNYEGATVRNPGLNESIVCIGGDLYSIDKSPTIGLPNDREGTYGTMRFKIFYPDKTLYTLPYVGMGDKNDQYTIEGQKYIMDLERQNDGSYLGNACYCFHHLDKMFFKADTRQQYHDYWTFRPLSISEDWDSYWNDNSIIEIHLEQFVSINSIQAEQSPLKIYPNPVREKFFDYQTDLPVKPETSYLEVVGIGGQVIGQYPVSESKGTITLPANIATGIYSVCLIVDKKNYATTKIIVQ